MQVEPINSNKVLSGYTTKLELSIYYNISYATIKRYAKSIGLNNKRYLTPNEVQQFINHFGSP